MIRIRLWTTLILVFRVGTLTGLLGGWLYLHARLTQGWEQEPAAQREEIMMRLTQALSLTAAQQAEIEPIVTRIHLAILEVRFAHQSEIEDILTRGISDLSAQLSPDQQDDLDESYARLKDRWQQSRAYLEKTKERLASRSSIP